MKLFAEINDVSSLNGNCKLEVLDIQHEKCCSFGKTH